MATLKQFVCTKHGDAIWLPRETHPWSVYRLQCPVDKGTYDYHLVEVPGVEMLAAGGDY